MATFFFSVLSETRVCAERTGLGCHSHRRRAGNPGHSGLSDTSSFETLALGFHYRSGKIAPVLGTVKLWALLLRVTLQGAGWQLLGSSGTSTPATNKLNWMFEAFITWHRGAPIGFICLLQKQNVCHMQLQATRLRCFYFGPSSAHLKATQLNNC